MKIVIAPDSFKECLTAAEVAETLAAALREVLPGAQLVLLPLADGGEGTLDVLSRAGDISRCEVSVQDPLGRPALASYGVRGETAFIEVAQACGMQLLKKDERNPLVAHTKGLGELILAARKKGCSHFVVALGGTVTCDGGAGMLSVPGVKELLGSVTVELLCDVKTPFLGPEGAVRVFAPQKGASPQDLDVLELRMATLAREYRQETGVDMAFQAGAGAAGGLAGAFMAYAHAEYRPGAQRVMELLGFERAIEGAGLIITGEGKSDSQTLLGKVPHAVLQRAKGIPVALLSGRIEDRALLEEAGFQPVLEVSPRDLPLPEALHPETAKSHLQKAVSRLARPVHGCL